MILNGAEVFAAVVHGVRVEVEERVVVLLGLVSVLFLSCALDSLDVLGT